MSKSKEIWKDIPGYERLYKISTLGNIYSYKTNKQMTNIKRNDGYLGVGLSDINHKSKTFRIHQLVALTFIPNTNNYPTINHKNENKSDNRVENLEWCTVKYNSNYGLAREKISKALKGKPKSREAVQKRLETMKIKLANMTKEERSKMFGREWTNEKRIKFAQDHKRDKLNPETLRKMSEAKKGKVFRSKESYSEGSVKAWKMRNEKKFLDLFIMSYLIDNSLFVTPFNKERLTNYCDGFLPINESFFKNSIIFYLSEVIK